PNVDSAVIQIRLHHNDPWNIENESLFFRIVKAGFAQRRKQLGGVLAAALSLPKDTTAKAFADAGLFTTVRIESLTMEQLAALTRCLAACL
ncbi:MAG: 16S rRNA (adenine(1518)-N(6)/adenine(1519)-N(6))-dimethyltransferase, partial [Oscillospiraceae bacterium]|nr:16S rRNA (adenine(1518)-N(6)/adenine(1519)-N(6))-dimethyltransferase [Oscillospiraceae bacterium]